MTEQDKRGLGAEAARNLATTTKTVPQVTGVTPRWLLSLLPWVPVEAGVYRVNRRRMVLGDVDLLRVSGEGETVTLDPAQLEGLPVFRGMSSGMLEVVAGKFKPERFDTGETIVSEGDRPGKFYVLASGKVEVTRTGKHGESLRLNVLSDGSFFGEMALIADEPRSATIRALTPLVLLTLSRDQFNELLDASPELRTSLERSAELRRAAIARANEYGEIDIDIAAGFDDGGELSETFVDYEPDPREYELSSVQAVVSVPTRVTDLFNSPIDQLREQLRLTTLAMRERQEHEIINNPTFGLMHNVAASMRVPTRSGPPTPDDMDELLAKVWKEPCYFLAHPRAIAAFGRECTRRGVPPPTVHISGSSFITWRGVPIVPCDKLLVDGRTRPKGGTGRTKILLMRTGEARQGVVGLTTHGLQAEQSPGLSVRFMGINQTGAARYLMTLYYSAAVLTEDALGALEDVEVGSYYDYAR